VESRGAAATVALAEVGDGHTVADIRALLAAGAAENPDWLSVVATYQAPPNAPFVVAPDLGPGRYAVGCIQRADGSVTVADGMLTVPADAG
jgi:hypothetical protein